MPTKRYIPVGPGWYPHRLHHIPADHLPLRCGAEPCDVPAWVVLIAESLASGALPTLPPHCDTPLVLMPGCEYHIRVILSVFRDEQRQHDGDLAL